MLKMVWVIFDWLLLIRLVRFMILFVCIEREMFLNRFGWVRFLICRMMLLSFIGLWE